MKKVHSNLLVVAILLIAGRSTAQDIKIDTSRKNLTFTGTQGIKIASEDQTAELVLTGYVSTYYARYNDSVGQNNFQQLPTVSPYNDRFGLNLVQIGSSYNSKKVRGVFTIHWGDIPNSAWSSQYNMIQEANVGFKLAKKLWFDLGFFRTHIGLESIQPRENIASSIATTTYFEPYFMSGAKLTYKVSELLALQLNVFNSFNTYVETNKNKAFGLSAYITPSDALSITVNTITSDESDIQAPQSKQRLYTNIYTVYHSKNIDLGAEYNFGVQQNSNLSDSTKTAYMNSALFAIKYKRSQKLALYYRQELFLDPNEILTGPIENSDHDLVGLDIIGETLGIEYKLVQNSYMRLEGRTIHTKPNENIFNVNHSPTNHREEAMLTMGVWF